MICLCAKNSKVNIYELHKPIKINLENKWAFKKAPPPLTINKQQAKL